MPANRKPPHPPFKLFPIALLAVVLVAPTAARAQSGDRAATVESARAAARGDRNREAAQLFEQAIARDPASRREVLQEYADQLVYAARPREAIALFQEVLQAPRDDAERGRALKGLGLAFLWTDQPGRARPLYEELVRMNPADMDAQRNLGRALSWSGRQREAAVHLKSYLATQPQDNEARVQLAQAQAWMGRPDVALATLEGMDRDDARQLRDQLARDTAPRTETGWQGSNQTDSLDIRTARLAHTLPFSGGRGRIGLSLERFDYEREDGTDSARVTRPMLVGRYRFSDAFEWNLEAGRQRISPQGAAAIEFTPYNTWLTWWPNDLLRFDLSGNRGDFDNLRSLRLGLTHQDRGLSADFTPSERQRYSARFQSSDYSDGNRRRGSQLEGEVRWLTLPDTWVGLRHTRFSFDRQLDNGYFNPARFESTLATLRTRWRPDGDNGRWELEARAAWGREHAVPDGGKPAYDVSLRAAWRLDAATRIEARAQRFSSRTSSSSGFARSIVGVALERTWQ